MAINWDEHFMSPEDFAKIKQYQELWFQTQDPKQRESLHQAAEMLRAKYGYSGGVAGNEYIPTSPVPIPQIPEIPEYQSPYASQIQNLLDRLTNLPEYRSPYEDLINQQLSAIMNRPKFTYDPDTDPAYQAFLQRAMAAGEKAYADNLGGLAAMTGGRPNSWAATVASQARNQYMLQAQEAVLHFEERAYQRYRDETADMYNLLNTLHTLDLTAYNRYRDQITDIKDLANFVLSLDQMEFDRFRYMTDLRYRIFEYEYEAYKDALQNRKNKIQEAMDRTNLLGYVTNQDAIILGVPAGTLSQAARERVERMEDYIKQAEIDLENKLKIMQEQKKIDLELIKVRSEEQKKAELELIKARSNEEIRVWRATTGSRPAGGSISAGGSKSAGGGSGTPSLTISDGNKVKSIVDNFNKFTSSKEYQRLPADKKYQYINNTIAGIIKDAEDGLYGKNSLYIANAALERIAQTEAYRKHYEGYERNMHFFFSQDKILYDERTPSQMLRDAKNIRSILNKFTVK